MTQTWPQTTATNRSTLPNYCRRRDQDHDCRGKDQIFNIKRQVYRTVLHYCWIDRLCQFDIYKDGHLFYLFFQLWARRARARRTGVASITPSASSTPAEGLRGARLPVLQAPCVPPRRWRQAKPSGAHQHAHPACRDPGGSAACASPCPRASERLQQQQW